MNETDGRSPRTKISAQKLSNIHGLPSPIKFSRARSLPSKSVENRCCQGVVLSLDKPHNFIAASPQFLKIVGFTFDQIRDHGIQGLVGPKTDTAVLFAAITNIRLMQSVAINTIIYTSQARELEIVATLLPHINFKSGILGSCLLRIDCIRDGDGTSFLLEDFGANELWDGADSSDMPDAATKLESDSAV